MTTRTAFPGDEKYATAAARMLSGMVLLYLLSAGAAAIIAFAAAAIVLMLHREREYARLFARIGTGMGIAGIAWIVLYCRSSEMRILLPLSQLIH